MELDLIGMAELPEWKEILVDVVKKQNLNPWDIDISLVSQKYLDRIKELKQLNLRVSANVVLAASILLRYKSDSWILGDRKEELLIAIPDEIYSEPVFPQLESVLRTTTRKVSLEELIAAVEDIMSKEKKKAERQSRVMDRYVPDDILELVNNKEDFEKKLKDSLEEIKRKADEENLVLFSDLLEDKTSEDVINHLLPLLFLANDKKVSMWQEKAFGEIFILLLDAEIKLFKEEKNGGKRAEKTGRSSAVHVA
jgi:segregation and condensation protein A